MSTIATDGAPRVVADPDRIEQVALDSSDDKAVYDLVGRKVKNPQKGIFIIGRQKVVK